MRWIAVFGSGGVGRAHPTYKLAQTVGTLLAEAGFGVITGGYFGVMEAASRAAKDVGGRVRSVPCREFSRDQIHPYADEIIWTSRYEDRIRTLIALADGFLVLPGGIGTMAELFYAWSLTQVRAPRHKPLGCIDTEFFRGLVNWLKSYDYIQPPDWERLHIFDRPEEAVNWLKSVLR